MVKAQLAKPIYKVEALLKSDKWAMQQKLDGQRMIVKCGEKVEAFNREGAPKKCPKEIMDYFSTLSTSWTFDGELIDSKFYMFDILEIPTGNIQNWTLERRDQLLTKLSTKLADPIYKVPLIRKDKKEVFESLQEKHVEGVVFKQLEAPYLNKKTYNFLKYKFVNDVDCVVLDAGFEDKSNLVLGMYDGREFVEVGRVSSLTGDGPKVQIGDVVKVTILYSTKDNRLYQPVKPMIRTDKKPKQCHLSQMKETRTCRDIFKTVEGLVDISD
jgi:ATP-dependent DNA ligase